MTKPQRIFHCDSGWCIDLDMVTYIDIPKIEDTTVKLKIGIRSSVTESFVIHTKDFSRLITDAQVSYRKYLKDVVYSVEISQLNDLCEYWDTEYGRLNILNSGRWDIEHVLQQIDVKVDDMIGKYIEAEFKVFHTKLKTAWCEWVDYKEGK